MPVFNLAYEHRGNMGPLCPALCSHWPSRMVFEWSQRTRDCETSAARLWDKWSGELCSVMESRPPRERRGRGERWRWTWWKINVVADNARTADNRNIRLSVEFIYAYISSEPQELIIPRIYTFCCVLVINPKNWHRRFLQSIHHCSVFRAWRCRHWQAWGWLAGWLPLWCREVPSGGSSWRWLPRSPGPASATILEKPKDNLHHVLEMPLLCVAMDTSCRWETHGTKQARVGKYPDGCRGETCKQNIPCL